jgi:hypothetical protein
MWTLPGLLSNGVDQARPVQPECWLLPRVVIAVARTFAVYRADLSEYFNVPGNYRVVSRGMSAGHVRGRRPFTSVQQAEHQLGQCRQRLADYLDGTVWFRPRYGIGDEPVEGYAGLAGWHAHGRDLSRLRRG